MSDPRERKCDIIYENLLRPLSDLNGGNKTCKLKKSLRSRLLEGSCWWWNKFPSLSFRYIAAFHFTEQNRKESSAKATRINVPEICWVFEIGRQGKIKERVYICHLRSLPFHGFYQKTFLVTAVQFLLFIYKYKKESYFELTEWKQCNNHIFSRQ